MLEVEPAWKSSLQQSLGCATWTTVKERRGLVVGCCGELSELTPGLISDSCCTRMRNILSNGVSLHVTDRGQGIPAVVFLHCWGGSTRTWDRIIAALHLDTGLWRSTSAGGGHPNIRPAATVLRSSPTTPKVRSRPSAWSAISSSATPWAAKRPSSWH